MLEKAVAVAWKRGKDAIAAERALDVVRALVDIPNAGGFYSIELMPDPEAVCRARRHAAEEIVRSHNQDF